MAVAAEATCFEGPSFSWGEVELHCRGRETCMGVPTVVEAKVGGRKGVVVMVGG